MTGQAVGAADRDFPGIFAELLARRDLDADLAAAAIGAIVDGTWHDARAGAFLTALALKGESVPELVGMATAMRARGVTVTHGLASVVDTCGTGGDGACTINVSTAAAFAVAGCGLAVAKHGNRAASGTCGSADVLEALGVPIDEPPEQAAVRLGRDGFAFLFAPRYHPAARRIAPVRRALGIRTIFNLLGPLVNPARATSQIVGVAEQRHLLVVAEALVALGVGSGAVVRATSGIDEIAGDCPTEIVRFGPAGLERARLDPADVGVGAPADALAGGDAATNAGALLAIVRGERSPRADVVALNAALALVVAGRAESVREGLAAARASLRSGASYAVFEAARSALPVNV